MLKIAALSALLLLPTVCLAEESTFTCKQFVTSYMGLTDRENTKLSDVTPEFARTVGFLMGAYLAKTGEPFGAAEEKGVARFERDVVAECSRNPKSNAGNIILSLADKISRVTPASSTTSKSNSRYTEISITDFLLDIAKLKGKRVQVSGDMITVGEMAMIGNERFSTNKVMVETKNLPRDQRKSILESCEGGCTVTIRGKVGSVMFNEGLIAEDLQID